jgi:hypothetical protein
LNRQARQENQEQLLTATKIKIEPPSTPSTPTDSKIEQINVQAQARP